MKLNCPTALRSGAIAFALSLFIGQSSAAETIPFKSREWLNHYYSTPNPDQFVPALFELSRNGYFALPGHTTMGIGFVASVLRQNPDRVDEWLLNCRPLPEREKRLLVAALWYAGFPKGAEYLQFYADCIVTPEMGGRLLRAINKGPEFDTRPIHSSQELYLQWGVFLATGDNLVLERIFEAVPQIPNFSPQQRWWFARTVAEHQQVIDWCRQEGTTQSADEQDLVRLVLYANPATIAD